MDWQRESTAGRVIGDAAAPHVVTLHAVDEGGDSFLQGFQNCSWLSSDSPFWYCSLYGPPEGVID
jgi:hypothetical protein